MSRPWTEREDTFLVYWGSCLNAVFMNVSGFHFVAEHDLNRTPQEADEIGRASCRERVSSPV